MKRKSDKKKLRSPKRRKLQTEQSIADGLELRRIRKEHGWSQRKLARMLKVRQPLLSAWEGGSAASPRMYARLTALPLPYKDQIWAARRAGWEQKTIEMLADGLLQARGAPPLSGETVRIRPMPEIESEGPDLILSKTEVPDTPLVFYIRVHGDSLLEPLFSDGDIIVVDASANDLRNTEDGTLVAVKSKQTEVVVWAGWLRKYDTPFGDFADVDGMEHLKKHSQPDVKTCMLQLPGSQKLMYVGTSGPGPSDNAVLLGHVIAWFKRRRSQRPQGKSK